MKRILDSLFEPLGGSQGSRDRGRAAPASCPAAARTSSPPRRWAQGKLLSLVVFALLAARAGWAGLNFSAVPLGDKTTSPRQNYDFTSSTQNVILAVRVENTEASPQVISQLKATFSDDISVVYNRRQPSARTVFLVQDTDGDGDLRTPSGRSRSELIHSAALQVQGSSAAALFSLEPDITVPVGVSHLFIVYDASELLDDHAVVDAKLAGPSDVAASAAVAFAGEIDSSGKETAQVVAVTLQVDNSTRTVAGVPFRIEIRAVDDYANLDEDADTVVRTGPAYEHPAGTSPGGYSPVYPPDTALVNGYAALWATLYAATETARVGFTYVSGSPPMRFITGLYLRNSKAVQVLPADVSLALDPVPSPQKAGVPFAVYARLGRDVYGNSAAGGVLWISGGEGGAAAASDADEKAPALAPSYPSPLAADGLDVATFTVTLYRAGAGQRLAAGVNFGQSSQAPALTNPFDVAHGGVNHLHLRVPSRAEAGAPFTGTVLVHDAYNNLGTGYAGSLRYEASSTSSRDALPSEGGAPEGFISAPITLFTPGPTVLRVYDTASPALSAEARVDLELTSLISKTIVFPSPYRPREGPLTIRFYAESDGPVKAAVYNFASEKVWESEVHSSQLGAENLKLLSWPGKDERGGDVPSGVYTCVLETAGRKDKVKFGLIH